MDYPGSARSDFTGRTLSEGAGETALSLVFRTARKCHWGRQKGPYEHHAWIDIAFFSKFLSDRQDYVGLCINVACLQKLGSLRFAVSRRGINLFPDSESLIHPLVVKQVHIRGIEKEELVYVFPDELEKLSEADKSLFRDPRVLCIPVTRLCRAMPLTKVGEYDIGTSGTSLRPFH